MAYTEAQNKATQKYKAENWKRVPLDLPINECNALKEYTQATGQTVSGFLRKIIKENIK